MCRARPQVGARLALLTVVFCNWLAPVDPSQPDPDCLGSDGSSGQCFQRAVNVGGGRLDLVIALPTLPARLPAGTTTRIVSAVDTLLTRGIFDVRIAVARPPAAPTDDVSTSIDVLTPGFVVDVAAVATMLQGYEATPLEPGLNIHGAGSCGPALETLNVLERVLALGRRRDKGGMGGRPDAHFHAVVLSGAVTAAEGAGGLGDVPSVLDDSDPRIIGVLANAAALLPEASVTVHVTGSGGGGCAAALGDAGCEDTYSDGTGLNKALTATCLLNRGLGTSLQARLLDAGLRIKIRDADAEDGDGAAWLAQVAWSTVGLASPTSPYAGGPAGGYGRYGRYGRSANAAAGSSPGDLGALQVRDVPVGTGERWFVEQAIERGTPVVFNSGTVVDGWDAARHWSDPVAFLERLGPDHAFVDVKRSRSGCFMDQDETAAMAGLLPERHRELRFTTLNMTAGDFFASIGSATATVADAPRSAAEGRAGSDNGVNSANPADSEFKFLHFMTVPKWLQPGLEPSRELFWTDSDHKLRKQYLWLSSAGAVTHTHFDQDHNIFVQLAGHKRFTLFPAAQHRYMHTYPRLHPLWHKSQCSVDTPNLDLFPAFAMTHPFSVTVGPGDVLYIPPYTWHHVETLEPSISMATLSHDDEVRNGMQFVYGMDHKFDLLVHPHGKIFALRLFLDVLVRHLYGDNPTETATFFASLVAERYATMRGRFADEVAQTAADCHFDGVPDGSGNNTIPSSTNVYLDCIADVKLVAPAFAALKGEVRDVLFADYVEELAAQVVGVEHVVTFYEHCFAGQGYFATDPATPIHGELWRHYDEELDGQLE